ncbi:MAG: tetratricopeptide repeat protein [Acidobacteriota bacterium]
MASDATADVGALAASLIEAADAARYRNPLRALDRAASARAFAASLDVDEVAASSRGGWLALQSDAWAVYGSAARSAGDLETAESALLVGLAFLDATPEHGRGRGGDRRRVRRARLAQRAGYVRMDQGRFQEAFDLFDQARDLYRTVGDPGREACVRVDVALALQRSGRRREAISELAAALEALDRSDEPRSYLAAVHNLARLLLEVADSAEEELEALRWLELASREHRRTPEPLHLLRLRAIAALTAARLGRVAEAAAELEALYVAFSDIGAAGDQVLTLLHLADLSLQPPGSTTRRAAEMAGRIFPLLRHLPVDVEAKAALRRLLARIEEKGPAREALSQAVDLMERNLGSKA